MRTSLLGIRSRVLIGCGILVAISLALAGTGIWNLGSIDGRVSGLVSVAEASARALRVGQLIERTGRLALFYKVTGETAERDLCSAAQQEAMALLQEAAEKSPRDDVRQAYRTMIALLEDYRGKWQRAGVLVEKIKDDRSKLYAAGDDLLAATNALQAASRAQAEPGVLAAGSEVENAVVGVRIANWRFLIAPAEAGVAAFQGQARAAAERIDAMASQRLPTEVMAAAARLKSILQAYQADFAAVADGVLASNALFLQQMKPIVDDISAKIHETQALRATDFTQNKDAAAALIDGTTATQKIVAAVAVLMGGLISMGIARSVVRPVSVMTVAMRRLAEGDTGIDIPSMDARDEIGAMAKSVEVFRQNARDRVRLEAERAQEQERAAQDKRKAMLSLAEGFERNVGGIVAQVAEASAGMETTARSMAATAERATGQAATVAAASNEATVNVQAVAAATEELSASISDINRQVVSSTRMALKAVDEAKRTDGTVAGLAEGARKIGDVVSLIQTIANQTNLLALNATIEAARAGDAGKGFAVVASEVKNLAGQTAKATEEIAAQINAIQSATADAVAAIQGIGETISEMNTVSASIAAAIEQQGSATKEIAASVSQAARGTEAVSANIAGVTDASNEVGGSARQVLDAASGMSQDSVRLRTEVNGFLATLRSA